MSPDTARGATVNRKHYILCFTAVICTALICFRDFGGLNGCFGKEKATNEDSRISAILQTDFGGRHAVSVEQAVSGYLQTGTGRAAVGGSCGRQLWAAAVGGSGPVESGTAA